MKHFLNSLKPSNLIHVTRDYLTGELRRRNLEGYDPGNKGDKPNSSLNTINFYKNINKIKN